MNKLSDSSEYLDSSTSFTGLWARRVWKVEGMVGAPTVDQSHPPLSTSNSTWSTPWTTAPVKGFIERPRNSQPYCYCWFSHTSLKSSFPSRSCCIEVTS